MKYAVIEYWVDAEYLFQLHFDSSKYLKKLIS